MQDLMGQAVELMTLGMGVVFSFLAVLVVAMIAMSKAIQTWFPEPDPEPETPTPSPATVDPKVQKAIELAVAQYRKKHR